MKKLLFVAALVAAAISAQAQGTLTFVNRATAVGLDQPVFDVGGTARLDGANYVAALFVNGVQVGATAPFRTGTGAGYWNPGTDNVRTVAGVASGADATVTVRAWDSTAGATFDAAQAAGGKYGESAPFTVTLGGGGTPPGPPGDMVNFKSFSLVPEPSVIALGALGAAALFLRRRK